MAHWLDSWPALRVMQKTIDAETYNTIRVAVLRQSLPWSLPLGAMCCLRAILDEQAWVCVDNCHNHLPLLAWTGFDTAGRASLNDPVTCELRLYHIHAGLLMGGALDALAASAAAHNGMPRNHGAGSASIVSF